MTRQPLRIAFVDYVLEPDKPGRTGLSDMVWDMAVELRRQGHEAHVIASYRTACYPDHRVHVHNFPAPPMGYRNIVGQMWLLKRAATIARRLQPDVVHAPEYMSTAVLATLQVRVPLVLTVPGNIYYRIHVGQKDWYPWHEVLPLKWAARTSASKCARVIAISKEMKTWWEWTGSAPHRTPWIPLGVNSRRFFPVPHARQQLGLPGNGLLLLYVGRFTPDKGLDGLLRAVAAIKHRLERAAARIVLIGRGCEEDELWRIVRSEGLSAIVQIRPWVPQDDLRSWYSAADALLLPSRSEGFSRTIPEAMICGTPVVGTRITGTVDHIQDGVNGFLVPPNDPGVLASSLLAMVEAPESLHVMREVTRSYALRHLTWSCIVERLVNEIYYPVVEEHSVHGQSLRR